MKKEKKHPVSIFLTNFLIALLTMAVLAIFLSGWFGMPFSDPIIALIALSILSASISTFFRLRRK